MMADVYGMARRVLIWVGESGEADQRDGLLAAPVLALWMVQVLSDFAVENRFPCTGSAEVNPQRLEKIWDAFLEAVVRSTESEDLCSPPSKTLQNSGAPRLSLIRRLLCYHLDDTESAVAAPQLSSSPRRDASRRQQLWREDLQCCFKVKCPCECKLLATVTITPQSFASLACECLGELLVRPWFGRMWVLQEVVLAQDALFHYGCHAIPLQHLYYAVDTLRLAFEWHRFGAAQLDPTVVKRAALLFTIVGWGQGAPARSMSLGRILYETRSLEHSEPRDRVYGLLSMVDQDSVGPFSVRPDYTIPLARLWARVAVALLTSRPALTNKPYEFLCLAGLSGRQRPMSRPSWAPDFGYLSIEGAAAWERKMEFCNGGDITFQNPLTGKLFQQDFIRLSASGDSKLDIDNYDDEHWHRLPLRGIAVAKIRSFLPNSQFPKHPQEGLGLGLGLLLPEQVTAYAENLLFPWYIRCMRFLFDDGQATYESWKSYLGLFLICQQGCIPMVPPGDTPPADAPAFDEHVSAVRAAADRAVAASIIEAPARIRIDPAQMVVDLIFFVSKMPCSWALDLDRVLALTYDKKLAWVPSTSQPGDLVTLFAGVPMPMIIRPVGGQGSANAFELVGEAYVEDLMSGNAWPEDASKLRMAFLV